MLTGLIKAYTRRIELRLPIKTFMGVQPLTLCVEKKFRRQVLILVRLGHNEACCLYTTTDRPPARIELASFAPKAKIIPLYYGGFNVFEHDLIRGIEPLMRRKKRYQKEVLIFRPLGDLQCRLRHTQCAYN